MAFEQHEKETDKAFAAFRVYLELGPERSLAAVAKKLGRSKSLIAAWSSKYHWQERLPAEGRALSPKAPSESLPSTINHQPSTPLDNSQLSPWDQQPGETGKNFDAFTTYLSLGVGRTLAKTAAATHRSKDQLAHWSQRWHWPARAAAYHAHLAAIERKATEDLVAAQSHDWAKTHESIRRQAWAEGEDLIALAKDFKARWRDSERLPDFGALIRALDLAFKLKQFAAGMPSEIKEVNTTLTGPDGGPLQLEISAALKKIYGQPLPGEVVDVDAAPAPVPPALPTTDHEVQP